MWVGGTYGQKTEVKHRSGHCVAAWPLLPLSAITSLPLCKRCPQLDACGCSLPKSSALSQFVNRVRLQHVTFQHPSDKILFYLITHTVGIYLSTVLEARSVKSKCRQRHRPCRSPQWENPLFVFSSGRVLALSLSFYVCPTPRSQSLCILCLLFQREVIAFQFHPTDPG